MKYIASCSFGKDSLCMLLRLIEEKLPLNEVVFYDTGKEYDCIYTNRDKIKELLIKNNIKYTELKPIHDFDYMMFDKPVKKRGTNIIHKNGYGWCGASCRWGTTYKIRAIEKYSKDCVEYVGIAHDEKSRLNKQRKTQKIFPLDNWKMSEKDCLQYCRDKGYNWLEGEIDLYDILDRVSCWCCRNKNLKELKNIYLYLPKYWYKLKEIETKLNVPMYQNKIWLDELVEKYSW